jgi:hypothetical protein
MCSSCSFTRCVATDAALPPSHISKKGNYYKYRTCDIHVISSCIPNHDMDPNTEDEISPPKCSKPGCKRFVNSSNYKRCNPCRTRQNALVKKSREQPKNTTHRSNTSKHARELEETSSDEERPIQRARLHNLDLFPKSQYTSSTDDEDEMPFYLETVCYCFMR